MAGAKKAQAQSPKPNRMLLSRCVLYKSLTQLPPSVTTSTKASPPSPDHPVHHPPNLHPSTHPPQGDGHFRKNEDAPSLTNLVPQSLYGVKCITPPSIFARGSGEENGSRKCISKGLLGLLLSKGLDETGRQEKRGEEALQKKTKSNSINVSAKTLGSSQHPLPKHRVPVTCLARLGMRNEFNHSSGKWASCGLNVSRLIRIPHLYVTNLLLVTTSSRRAAARSPRRE